MLNVSARIIPSPMVSPTTEQKEFIPREVEETSSINVVNIPQEPAPVIENVEKPVVSPKEVEINTGKRDLQDVAPVLSRIVEDYALEASQIQSVMVSWSICIFLIFC